MTSVRKFWKAVCLCFLMVLCISAVRPTAAQAAKAREATYSAKIRKNCEATVVKTGEKKKFKKNTKITVTSRDSKNFIFKYKGTTYKVSRKKVSLGKMAIKSSKFSKKSAEDFVNKRKYSSSTKYLLWISLYSQHVYIFKGKKGNWTLSKSFICSTGANQATPYGKGKVGKKQMVWYFEGVACARYATRVPGGAIHTWASGGFGVPRSHGCVRVATANAKYVYKKIPTGTGVIVM